MDSAVKFYRTYNLSDASIFEGYVDDYEVPVEVLKKLAKYLGFSYDLYLTMCSIDKSASSALVESMSKQSNHPEVILLLDDSIRTVLGYVSDMDRNPVLNSEFISTVEKLVSTCDNLYISEKNYIKEDTVASVIIKKRESMIIEETYEGKEPNKIPYDVGILLTNDELSTASSRLVVYVDHQPLYLPASVYSTSTTRYKRSTSSSLEALEVLLLKSIEDLRDNLIDYKIKDLHYRYRYNKNVVATYEEYNELVRIMRKIPTIIEDNTYIESLLSISENFERKYTRLEDMHSSYLWRCTALSELTIEELIHSVCSILNNTMAPPVEYSDIRDKLGYYISTPRIVDDIAKESSI